MGATSRGGRGRRTISAPLFALTLLPLMLAGEAKAAGPVLPTGGKVAAGSAVIGQPAGGALTINQSSSKAIINWNGFSIGSGGKVQFDNGSGATLNRVTGTSLSSIDGLLSGTGSVYLINPNGVIIGKSGVVNVGGTFVASTLDIANSNFLVGGDLTFSSSSPSAVINYGKMGALGGDVALIAARVENDGAITAANGTAGLIAGYSVILRDASLNDGKFSVLVGGPSTSVANGGTIAAANAELRAEGGNVYALAGDTAGVIRATGVKSDDGKVWLVADGGTLDVVGAIEAQGPNGSSGSIETSGHTVNLGAASINAHGGTWTLDPDSLEITRSDAQLISTTLTNGTSVVEQTGPTMDGSGAATVVSDGNGDITLDANAAIAWNGGAALTLSAYRNLNLNGSISLSTGTLNLIAGTGNTAAVGPNTGAITVNAPITVSDAGTVNLTAANDTQTVPGTPLLQLSFAPGASLQFTGQNAASQPTGALTINGTGYTLVRDLATLSADITNDNSGAYALASAVDGSNGGAGYSGSPLASTINTPFAGTLEGLGDMVNNLTIADTEHNNVGLLGQLGVSGLLRNFELVNASLNSSSSSPFSISVGALVGTNAGLIQNVHSSGQVVASGSDESNVGGLVGDNTSVVAGASATGSLRGYSLYVGGLIGRSVGVNGSATVTDAHSSVAVVADLDSVAGGLIGASGNGTVSEVYATGDVSGAVMIGGLIGSAGSGAEITNAYAVGSVTAGAPASGSSASVYAGGLIGVSLGSSNSHVIISNASATGGVTGNGFAGGLIGYAEAVTVSDVGASGYVNGVDAGGLIGMGYNVDISSAQATGAVTGSSTAGGLLGKVVGALQGAVSQVVTAYATGAVTGSSTTANVGGLVGFAEGVNIVSVYATGPVSGGALAGGLVGEACSSCFGEADPLFLNTYYDRATTGQVMGLGTEPDAASGITGVNGNSGLSPYSTSTYAGFDFGSTWFVVEGSTRPFLRSEYSTTITNDHQLQLMALNPTANYTQVKDIDLSDLANPSSMWNPATGFSPIGLGEPAFTGAFNGQGHLISALGISLPSGYNVGLFGVVGAGGVVENLTLAGGMVAGSTFVGELAGLNFGTLSNDHVTGFVVATNANSGDLVGYNAGTVAGSSATGWSTGGWNAGGLVGFNDVGGVVMASNASGAVQATHDVGGLVGLNAGTIGRSYATGDMSASDAVVGGLVGYNSGPISNTYATGWAAATGYVAGGLVGFNDVGGQISEAYSTGGVTGKGSIAGAAGINAGTLSNLYWDMATSGTDVGIAVGSGPSSVTGIGGAGASPYAQLTYSGFDFAGTWAIIEGTSRPYFQADPQSPPPQ